MDKIELNELSYRDYLRYLLLKDRFIKGLEELIKKLENANKHDEWFWLIRSETENTFIIEFRHNG